MADKFKKDKNNKAFQGPIVDYTPEGKIFAKGEILEKNREFLDNLPEQPGIRKIMRYKRKRRGAQKGKYVLPSWFFPGLIMLMAIAFVLSGAPEAFRQMMVGGETRLEDKGERIYGDDMSTVLAAFVYLRSEARPEAPIITSAIFNEPVKILEKHAGGGYSKVELADGVRGYTESRFLSKDANHIEPKAAVRKIIVLAAGKRIMSHTLGGSPLMAMPLGAVVYADYETVTVMRVMLADGQHGWISTDGIAVANPEGEIALKDKDPGRLFNGSVMSFFNSAYVPGGMTGEGCDMAGVIYIAGKINGLKIPRLLKEQAKTGREISYAALAPGDCIFFAEPDDSELIYNAAVVIEGKNVLMCQDNGSTIGIRNLDNMQEMRARIKAIRRMF